MKKHASIILVVIATVFFFSCDDDSKSSLTCGVANPVEDLPWLKTMIESFETNSTIFPYMYVQQGKYSGKTVFMVGNCCPFCDTYFPVYNCEGEEINNVIIQDITNLKTIWKPEDSQCTL